MTVKCAILGASGGIGQSLSLLCKNCPLIDELSLYDVVNTPGVAADLSHICTPSRVTGYLPSDDGLKKALTGADIVVIPAGVPRKPGMTRDDLFTTNSRIIAELGEAVAKYSPDAFILVISNPINSTVPIVAEVLKDYGVLNPRKLFGITTLDSVRLSTFISEYVETDMKQCCYSIPVVGGHSSSTIIPLISHCVPEVKLSQEQLEALIYRVQYAGDEVVKAKNGIGSSTLSMAYAALVFIEAILKAKSGVPNIVQCSFVCLSGIPGSEQIIEKIGNLGFFAAPLELGVNGIERIKFFDFIYEIEKQLLKNALVEIKENIDKGILFYAEYKKTITK